jgi:hypothetical protein
MRILEKIAVAYAGFVIKNAAQPKRIHMNEADFKKMMRERPGLLKKTKVLGLEVYLRPGKLEVSSGRA